MSLSAVQHSDPVIYIYILFFFWDNHFFFFKKFFKLFPQYIFFSYSCYLPSWSIPRDWVNFSVLYRRTTNPKLAVHPTFSPLAITMNSVFSPPWIPIHTVLEGGPGIWICNTPSRQVQGFLPLHFLFPSPYPASLLFLVQPGRAGILKKNSFKYPATTEKASSKSHIISEAYVAQGAAATVCTI